METVASRIGTTHIAERKVNYPVEESFLDPLRASAVKLFLCLRSWNELLNFQGRLSGDHLKVAQESLIAIQRTIDAINDFSNNPIYGNRTWSRLNDLPPRRIGGEQVPTHSRILEWWRDGMEIVNAVSNLLYPEQTLLDHKVVNFGQDSIEKLKNRWKEVKRETKRFLSNYDFSIELKHDKDRAPVLLLDEMWELRKEFGTVHEHPTILITYKSKPILVIAGRNDTVQISLLEACVVAIVSRLHVNEKCVMKQQIKSQLKSLKLTHSEQLLKRALNHLVKITFLRKLPGKYGYLPSDDILEVHWESRFDEFVKTFEKCRSNGQQK